MARAYAAVLTVVARCSIPETWAASRAVVAGTPTEAITRVVTVWPPLTKAIDIDTVTVWPLPPTGMTTVIPLAWAPGTWARARAAAWGVPSAELPPVWIAAAIADPKHVENFGRAKNAEASFEKSVVPKTAVVDPISV